MEVARKGKYSCLAITDDEAKKENNVKTSEEILDDIGVHFDPRPLTKEEEQMLSEFFRSRKNAKTE
jgi:hypothetical protein